MKLKNVRLNDIIDVKNKASFKIETCNSKVAKLMADTLYKEKEKSVFREIFSNAIDSQLISKSQNPIKILFNFNKDSLLLSIRDYGTGIDPDNIIDTYCTFFGSSKNETNKQIGGYGLGCKSPISITNSYNIENYFNGKCYKYEISNIDELVIKKIDTIDTNEHNGLNVIIPFFENNKSGKDSIFSIITDYMKKLICCSPIPIHVVFKYEDIEVSKIITSNKIKIDRLLFVDYREFIDLYNKFMSYSMYGEGFINEGRYKKYKLESYDGIIPSKNAIKANIINGFIPYEYNIDEEECKNLYEKFDQMIRYILLGKNKAYNRVEYYVSYNSNIEKAIYSIAPFDFFLIANIGELNLSTSREEIIKDDFNDKHIKGLIDKALSFKNINDSLEYKRIYKTDIKKEHKIFAFNDDDFFKLVLDADGSIYTLTNNRILENQQILICDNLYTPFVAKNKNNEIKYIKFVEDAIYNDNLGYKGGFYLYTIKNSKDIFVFKDPLYIKSYDKNINRTLSIIIDTSTLVYANLEYNNLEEILDNNISFSFLKQFDKYGITIDNVSYSDTEKMENKNSHKNDYDRNPIDIKSILELI